MHEYEEVIGLAPVTTFVLGKMTFKKAPRVFPWMLVTTCHKKAPLCVSLSCGTITGNPTDTKGNWFIQSVPKCHNSLCELNYVYLFQKRTSSFSEGIYFRMYEEVLSAIKMKREYIHMDINLLFQFQNGSRKANISFDPPRHWGFCHA